MPKRLGAAENWLSPMLLLASRCKVCGAEGVVVKVIFGSHLAQDPSRMASAPSTHKPESGQLLQSYYPNPPAAVLFAMVHHPAGQLGESGRAGGQGKAGAKGLSFPQWETGR